jgi:hypothetical protein
LSSRSRRAVAPAVAVVAIAIALAGCAGYTGDRAHQVAEWASGADLTTNDGYVTSDVGSIALGIKRRELVATHTACDGLASDAATAYGELPTPDTALTDDLNTAYLDFTDAAQDCSSVSSFAPPGFRRYERELGRAVAALDAADARLRAFGLR